MVTHESTCPVATGVLTEFGASHGGSMDQRSKSDGNPAAGHPVKGPDTGIQAATLVTGVVAAQTASPAGDRDYLLSLPSICCER